MARALSAASRLTLVIAVLSEGKGAELGRTIRSARKVAAQLRAPARLHANAGTVIRTKSRTVDRAKRIATDTELGLLIGAAPTKRDRLMLEVGYAGGLRVSELVSLKWADA